MEHLIALLPLLGSLPVFQGVAGFCAVILTIWMMTRASKDKQALPAPAPGGITDVPTVFAQGPRETIDLIRDIREFLRRLAEDSGHIRECVRITREEAKKQTEILDRMAEDQRVEHRVAAERHSRENG